MKPLALNAHNVYIAYNNNYIISNVYAEIPQGAMTAIVGPNGAGKTTFIKAIIGLLKPIAGTISCLGMPFTEYRHHVAYIPQRMSVDWDFPLSAHDIVLMGCYQRLGLFRRPSAADLQQAYECLEQVDMITYAHTPISELSGGQQQRIFLARALMQQASLFFLDEPFVGIDAVTEHTIITILQALCKKGKTVFIVHHDLASINTYFDWVLFLRHSTVACGPIATTYTSAHVATTFERPKVQHV